MKIVSWPFPQINSLLKRKDVFFSRHVGWLVGLSASNEEDFAGNTLLIVRASVNVLLMELSLGEFLSMRCCSISLFCYYYGKLLEWHYSCIIIAAVMHLIQFCIIMCIRVWLTSKTLVFRKEFLYCIKISLVASHHGGCISLMKLVHRNPIFW